MRELREIRLRRGLSQADLSAMTGVAEFTISGIESGKRANPRPSTLRKLAQALKVEVVDLYGGFDSPLAQAPPSPTQPPLNGPEEERRALYLSTVRKDAESVRQQVEEERGHFASENKHDVAGDLLVYWLAKAATLQALAKERLDLWATDVFGALAEHPKMDENELVQLTRAHEEMQAALESTDTFVQEVFAVAHGRAEGRILLKDLERAEHGTVGPVSPEAR